MTFAAAEPVTSLVAARRSAAAALFGADRDLAAACRNVDPQVRTLLEGLATLRTPHAERFAAIRDEQRVLLDRLRAGGAAASGAMRRFDAPARYGAQFDDGFEGLLGPGVLRGVRARGDGEISVTGLAGVPMSAEAIVLIAESVLTSARQRPERPLLLVLDEGPAAAVDESPPLSEYLVHLARVLAWARTQAVAVNVWLCGGFDAASYVASTAAALRVVSFACAVLRGPGTWPAAYEPAQACASWAAAGLVDAIAPTDGRVDIAWNASV